MTTSFQIYDISRQAGGNLSDRLAENLRKAIAAGELKGGDRLPSIRKMAELCGTSVRVPLAAVRRLQEEGVLEAHPRLGITILNRKHKLWKGRVLLVTNGGDANYYVNALNASVSSALVKSNYRVEFAFATPGGRKRETYDTLAKMLRDDYDLVIFPAYDERIVKIIKASGLPYLVYSSDDFVRDVNCIGILTRSGASANEEFLGRCAEKGVRRVLQMRFSDWRGSDLSKEFRSRSIAVENLEIPLALSPDRLDVITQTAYAALSERLADWRRPLPDLVFFADDFIARGGLWALASSGLRVPEDVAVVTVSNRGFLPGFSKPLTRLENDTFGNARQVVRQALRYLERHQKARLVALDRHYVPGETF